ncbi:hypothetical protein MLD38_006126 [Melastoma candidum]|uniref:Uncharacterized protein n=1 Tax=Melastoma candidum TaxID=119954 RepID=A0ACB9RLX1_9MYRT|nr:hypothetical protein MLD38_006126 [Melastoma candidum]
MHGGAIPLLLVVTAACICLVVYHHGHHRGSNPSSPGISQTLRPAAISGSVFINGTAHMATTDEDFICATLDYGPPDVCHRDVCWGNATVFTLDLGNLVLFNAVNAFSPLVIRVGGTLQDRLVYQMEGDQGPCNPQTIDNSEFLGFSQGCLPMSRWDKLNDFFKHAGAIVTFGLNALYGRTVESDGSATGPWDSTNSEALLRYTVNRGYTIHGWELGNELSGKGIGARITAAQYASDLQELRFLVDEIYGGFDTKPLVLAPGGFFEEKWFEEFIHLTNRTLQVVTQHVYSLGAGAEDHLKDKILDPSYLNGIVGTFRAVQSILNNSGSSAVAWVSEAGGAVNSGRHLVTDAFMSSFWYLDQLATASMYDTKKFCRQTLIGGGYGLLNSSTFQPNPDYYSALLWHRLMGSRVLSTNFTGTNEIRAYSHCSKNSTGITMLLINLDGNTTVQVDVMVEDISPSGTLVALQEGHSRKSKFASLSKGSIFETDVREEYHLTAQDGDLSSQVALLNGQVLSVNSSGTIPPLDPKKESLLTPIAVTPFSIVFVRFPNLDVAACRQQ